MSRSILMDVNSGEFWSEEKGWNWKEVSIRKDWSTIIYHYSGPIGIKLHEDWKGRDYLCISLPYLPEIFT